MIEISGLNAAYNGKQVLSDVHASFSEGEFVCLTGPNGSGKSTFLAAAAALRVPSLSVSYKEITCSGKDLYALSARDRARIMAFLPQNEGYAWNYTVLEAVRMGRYAHSRNPLGFSRQDTDAALSALERVESAHLADRYIFELSGGELQSVLIARALAQETPVLILDEPFTFLDIGKADHLIKLLKKTCREKNTCVIMSLHEINMAPLYADRILVFSEGKKIADGTPEEAFTVSNLEKAYKTRFTLYTHPVHGVPQVCPL